MMCRVRKNHSSLLGCLILSLVGLRSAQADSDAPPTLTGGIPIHVVEHAGIPRAAEPTTFAVPLAKADDVTSTSALILLGPEGKPVHAQFRVQQRWNGGPADANKPIRWLLVDVQATVAANAEALYTLRKKSDGDKLPKKKPKLKIKEKPSQIKVDTGAARFTVSAKTMNFLERFAADLDGDGKVAAGETLIAAPAESGFILSDRFGAQYSSAACDVELQVEEKGKLRTIIRADGRHGPVVPGGGIGRDFFMYRTRFTFYAGKPYVRVQHTIRNAYLDDPLGSIGFEGYAVHTRLASGLTGAGPLSTTFGLDGALTQVVPGAARLYQDSDGGDSWALSSGTTFRGFKVYDGAQAQVAGGNQAAGTMHVGNGHVGLTVVMRDFFENFPKGFAFDGQDLVQINLFPSEFGTFHWLDDGQQKTTDLLLAAHGADLPDQDAVVNMFKQPLHPYPEPEWTRLSKAWGDHGDLDKPAASDAQMISYDAGQLNQVYSQAFGHGSYAFGWSEFGEMTWAKSTHTTGSPRNKLTYFDRFAITGSYPAFRINELFALHSRDVRPYHILGFSKEKHPQATLWEGLPVWSYSVDKLGRDQLDAALDPHRAGIPTGGHGWNSFDFEHMTVDDVYEYYLMTGDRVSLDSLQEIGECMRTWLIYDPAKAPGSTRGVGWGMRSLIKIYQVTGDERYMGSADLLLTSVANTYGQDASPVTGLVYHYVTAYPPHANHIPDDEYDLPWQLAVAVYGMFLHHRETGSALSREVALDVADYIVDYAWNGVAMNEALAVDDHNYVNYKGDNTGVNIWIPSALALAYRQHARAEFLWTAQYMFNSIPGLTDPVTYNGYSTYHWWHSYRALILGY
ncbi:MAG: hypothetical protein HY812_04175 [Planctomycetes bacterium]|nr:hypothetical protein [Planctomycetota bacterium]